MGPWLDRMAGPLLDAILAATAWFGVIALAMVANRQPARRCALARAGLVGVLAVMPLACIGLVPRFDLIAGLRAMVAPSWTWPPADRLFGSRWLIRGLTLAYLVGVAGGLARLSLGWWGWGWMSRHSVVPSRRTRELFEELAAGLPPSRRPRLRVARRLRRPGVLRVLRPLIVIPPELDRPEARDPLRLCLLHELAHAERRDPGFAFLGALVQALWFPLPHLWWVRAQMRLDHEFLADRRAAGDFGGPGSYASSLVALAVPSPSASGEGAASLPTPAGRLGSPLFRRILMLVRCPFPIEPRPPAWWRWSLPAATVCGIVLASTLTLRGPPPTRAPGPKTGTFRLARVSLPEPTPEGASAAEQDLLFFPLPPQFVLTLEVWAIDAEALAQIRVVGHPLGGPLAPRDPLPPSWHAVRLSRGDGLVSLSVDDRPILDRVPDFSTSPSLKVKPPLKGPGEFRNVRLHWSDTP